MGVSGPRAIKTSLDNRVHPNEQRLRNRQPERLGRSKVDDQAGSEWAVQPASQGLPSPAGRIAVWEETLDPEFWVVNRFGS